MTATDLVAALPALTDLAAENLRRVPGGELTTADLLAAARRIAETDDEVAGVVVLQGTDTIDETAFGLEFLLDLDTPVVVTGAMRHPAARDAEGPANVLGAGRGRPRCRRCRRARAARRHSPPRSRRDQGAQQPSVGVRVAERGPGRLGRGGPDPPAAAGPPPRAHSRLRGTAGRAAPGRSRGRRSSPATAR